MEAERNANKYKQVEYMQDYVGEEFDAVISGVASFGFWAETVEHKCEGMVSITDLSQFDDFEMREGEYALVGLHHGLRFGMGDRVRVKVAAANLDKRQIDFVLMELPPQQKAKNKAGKPAAKPAAKKQAGKKPTKRKK